MKYKYKIAFKNLMRRITKPYIEIRNRFLAKRYPWLVPFSGRAGDEEVYDYSVNGYLMWEPYLWGYSFFYLMMNDIRKIAKKKGIINNLHTVEQKEKWGQLVFWVSGADKEIKEVIDAYTTLSANICINCGQPDVGYYKSGWILPVCPKCFARDNPQKTYDELMSKDRKMADWFEYKRWDENKKEWIHYKIDIRPTANKIRKRWNVLHPFRKTHM